MFRFQHPEYFWFLLLIPVLILVYINFLGWRRHTLRKLGDVALVKNLIKGKINGRLTTKIVLVSLAMASLVVGLANLQAGGHPEKTKQNGLDVMFALDVSNSMLARDISPDRLTKAKELIYRTLNEMKNDRTGLVIFAGNAYLQTPLTVDYGAMRMLLSGVSPEMVPTQGTNFAEAIDLARQSFSDKDKGSRVLVLISDGEDHDQQALQAAKEASKAGIIIYAVGIGSPKGSTIYDPSTGQPKVDNNGEVVVTKLNEDELKGIAGATGGNYQLLNNAGQVASNLVKSLDQIQTKNLGTVTFMDYQSYFQYFLGAGLVFLLLGWLLPDAKKSETSKVGSKVATAGVIGLLALFFCLSPNLSYAQGKTGQQTTTDKQKPTLKFKKEIRSGNKQYDEKQYQQALTTYQEALKKDPKSFAGKFNSGDALYQSGKNEEARSAFMNSLQEAKTKEEKAHAWHNVGNTFLKDKKWKEAIDAYKKSLIQNPSDQQTKYNLAYAQKMLNQQNKGGGGQNKNQQNKQNQDQNKQDQNKQDQNKQDQNKQDQNKDQQNKDPQNKDQEASQQQQGQPSKLSKQQAENILNALNQEEQALHKKKKQQTAKPTRPEKDW